MASKSPGPGRPKDMEKRAAILSAAQQLFGTAGFDGTSMDAVAQAAGVSKLTVYSHFGDKDNLFREAVRQRCQELLPEHLYQATPGRALADTLLDLARHHARLMTSDEAVGVWRAIASNCRHGRPRMGQLLWEEGPQRTAARLERFLREQAQAGALDLPDPALAARQFLSLLKGDLHFRRLFGCTEHTGAAFDAAVDANARAAVEMFLRAYSEDREQKTEDRSRGRTTED